MQKFHKLKVILFYSFFSCFLFATDSLEVRLEKHQKKLRELSIQIADMGSSIDTEQSKYFKFLDLEKELRTTMKSIEQKLLEQEEKLLSHKIQTRHSLLKLNTMKGEEPSVQSLLNYRIEREKILNKLSKIKLNTLSLNKINSERERILKDLNEISHEKTIIHKIILDLESKKRNMLSKHKIGKIKEEVSLKKIESIKHKITLIKKRSEGQNTKISFSFPLKGATDYLEKKPGLDIFYEETKKIYSISDGEVIHVSDLSSYGRVIIIKHSKSMRSVLLGKLKLRVKKGDYVSKDEVLGEALVTNSQMGKLYFELRVEDRPTKLSKYFDLSRNF